MSLLGDNTANYRNASLLMYAEKMRDKNYMVIHGTYDDNVHYQQSMMLSYELERRVILFRQQVSYVRVRSVAYFRVFEIIYVRFLVEDSLNAPIR